MLKTVTDAKFTPTHLVTLYVPMQHANAVQALLTSGYTMWPGLGSWRTMDKEVIESVRVFQVVCRSHGEYVTDAVAKLLIELGEEEVLTTLQEITEVKYVR
jgi:hypothetical protein